MSTFAWRLQIPAGIVQKVFHFICSQEVLLAMALHVKFVYAF